MTTPERKSLQSKKLMAIGLIVMVSLLYSAWYLREKTKIWNAVKQQDLQAIRPYAEQGGDLEIGAEIFGKTPLFYALEQGKKESYRELLRLGADPNTLCRGGNVVMHWSATEADPEWLRIALEHGGDPNLINERGRGMQRTQPMEYAIHAGRIENVKVLIEYGADVDKANPEHSTPLHTALAANEFKLVLYMLENGANYNYPAPVKNATFIWPCKNLTADQFEGRSNKDKEFQAILDWLVAHGADPSKAEWAGDHWEFDTE